ncbi:MAG: acetate--CoA ligase family protein [Planctomycetes bacterium]|nr:acetate--CoA ligase family protein [Planctomycetota bacterium]
MRLYEHEAKQVFREAGIPVPARYGVARSPEGLDGLPVAFPAMVKALALTGGRGKAGGVRQVRDPAGARLAAAEILALRIGDWPVEAVLVEEAVPFSFAAYLGITTSPETFMPVILASSRGGVDIEAAARAEPAAVLRRPIDDSPAELPPGPRDEVVAFLSRDLPGADAAALAETVTRLYHAFQNADAKVAEINPLLVLPDGRVVAADAKLVLDDNALFRQRPLLRRLGLAEPRHDASELTRDERRARAAGFKYVDLLPEDTPRDPGKLYVGLVPGGAGYGIFSIDEVATIGERFLGGRAVPVNFMDSGGGPSQGMVAEMFHLLMDKEIVDVVITSRFGGISSCDVFIRGLVACLRDRRAAGRRVLPVYGRMVGTDLPGARAFLERARAETPEALSGLELESGNRRIMAEVIRDGLAKALAGRDRNG